MVLCLLNMSEQTDSNLMLLLLLLKKKNHVSECTFYIEQYVHGCVCVSIFIYALN